MFVYYQTLLEISIMKDVMARLAIVFAVLIVGIIIVGGVVLATVDIPAPSAKVERPVPDDRLAK